MCVCAPTLGMCTLLCHCLASLAQATPVLPVIGRGPRFKPVLVVRMGKVYDTQAHTWNVHTGGLERILRPTCRTLECHQAGGRRCMCGAARGNMDMWTCLTAMFMC